MMSSTFRPLRRRRCGSISTWSWRSRKPQIETFDTPGTESRRWRIFQRASVDISTSVKSFDDIEKISIRPVVAEGWITNGGFETAGSAGTMVRRSCTTWRARTSLVPGSKIISTADRPGAEFERILCSHGIPVKNSCSIGFVIRFSASSGDRPRASVCTSTRTGPKSGSASTVVPGRRLMPTANRAAASTMTSSLYLALEPMIHCNMAFLRKLDLTNALDLPATRSGVWDRPPSQDIASRSPHDCFFMLVRRVEMKQSNRPCAEIATP